MKIPPLKIKDKNSWQIIRSHINDNNIQIKHVINKTDGLQILPLLIDDYRKLTKLLDDHHQKYFTYRLPDEKTLRVVLRGVPSQINIDDIKELQKSFQIINVHRMYKKNNGGKIYFPLILVELPKNEKSKDIYNLQYFDFFKIKGEREQVDW